MDKKTDREFLEFFEELLETEGLSRRDALKMFGLDGAATLIGSTSAQAATTARS